MTPNEAIETLERVLAVAQAMDDTKTAIALTYAIEAMKGKSNDR